MTHLVLAVVAAFALLAPRSAVANHGGVKAFPPDAVLIKEAVVAGAVLKALHPEIQDEDIASKQLWRLSSLVVAFDSRDTPDVRRQLVSLASYYLGEATNELYQCVLIRKGMRVHKLLKDLAASGNGRSIDSHSFWKAVLGGPASPRIANILEKISKQEKCELEP